MKKITGKFPVRNNSDCVGNSDCRIPLFGKELLEIVEDYVHAVRVEDDVVSIQPNTMYLHPNSGSARFNVIGTIETEINNRVPRIYAELISHMSPDRDEPNMFGELNGFNVESSPTASLSAIQINVNNKLAGYYIPEKNSWIAGYWSWHNHYVTIILEHLFPIFVDKLHIRPCDESIGAEKRRGSTPRKIEVTVGCDPELEVTKNGVVIRADTNLGIRDYTATEIGCDGAASQLEFRPKPGTPQQVVRNIRHLVKKFSETWDEFDLTDEGARFPLGGHIHIGVGHRLEVNSDYVRMLDDFIGRPTLDLSGSARGSYKALGMIRSQPHGLEYRSCPAAVFQNPVIAHIVFKLAKNLSERYFNLETFQYHDTPTVQDYIDVGGLSAREAKYFQEFCKNYKPVKSIRASWKVKPAAVVPTTLHTPLLEFHDDWTAENRENIARVFNDGIQLENEYHVTLYGLARERGSMMTTLHISNTTHHEPIRSEWSSSRHLNVGVSYDLRRYGMPNPLIRSLVSEVRSMIVERENEL